MRSRSHCGNVRQGCGLSMTGVKVCLNNTCTGRLNNNPRGFCVICTRRSVRQAEWCGPHLPSSTVQVGACAAVTGGNSSVGRGVVRQGSSGVTHPAYFRSVWGGGVLFHHFSYVPEIVKSYVTVVLADVCWCGQACRTLTAYFLLHNRPCSA
jgi:hypothetical protein